MSPAEISWMIFKVVVLIFVVSLISGILNYFPYNIKVNDIANQIALEVSNDNYLNQSRHDFFVNQFTNNTTFLGKLSSAEAGAVTTLPGTAHEDVEIKVEWFPNCNGLSFNIASPDGGSGKTLILRDGFNPEVDALDYCPLPDGTLKKEVPNRNDDGVIAVTIHARMKVAFNFLGHRFVGYIPVSTQKFATPMRYYGW